MPRRPRPRSRCRSADARARPRDWVDHSPGERCDAAPRRALRSSDGAPRPRCRCRQGGRRRLPELAFLGDEPDDVAFRIHRDGQLIATVTDSTNWTDPAGTATSSYEVEAVTGDSPLPRSAPVRPLANQAMDIPLQRPAPAVVPVAQTFETTVSGKQFEPVDMNLLRADPRSAHRSRRPHRERIRAAHRTAPGLPAGAGLGSALPVRDGGHHGRGRPLPHQR